MPKTPKADIAPLKPFDYESLTAEARVTVRQKCGEIRERMGGAARNLIEVGERLILIKELLGHGQFLRWLDTEFRWSESAAVKLMQVARFAKSVKFTDLNVGPSALYMLAAPSTPDEVRKRFIDQAASGEEVTHVDVASAVAAAKPPAKRKSKPPENEVTQINVPTATEASTEIEPEPQAEAPAAPAPDPVDEAGTPIPERLREAFATRNDYDKAMGLLTQVVEIVNRLSGPASEEAPLGAAWLPRQETLTAYKNLRSNLKFARPHAVCPTCKGKGCRADIGCQGFGYLTLDGWKRVPKGTK